MGSILIRTWFDHCDRYSLFAEPWRVFLAYDWFRMYSGTGCETQANRWSHDSLTHGCILRNDVGSVRRHVATDFTAYFSILDETQLASDGRINLWASCMGLIQDFWLTGSGLGTFGKIFRVYDDSPDGFIATHAENVYLQLACEGGLVMSVFVLIIVGVFFRTAMYMVLQRHTTSFAVGVMALFLLASQCLAGCFDFGLFIPANLYQLSLLLGVFASLAARAKSSEYSYKSKSPERPTTGRVSKKNHTSVVQGAVDRRFEIILVGLICLGCFSVPDLIRASSLETLSQLDRLEQRHRKRLPRL